MTRAIVIGAGGLGTPIASSLAAAGFAVDIYDPDVVDVSNLPRQVAYRTLDVDRDKSAMLAERINQRRHDGATPARGHGVRFDAAAAAAAPRPDIIIDGSDDPATKFWLADWASANGVPYIIASAIGTTGNVFASGASGTDGACYRCIFEAPPEEAPTCGDAGVLGPTVAVIGGFAAELAVAACGASDTAAPGRLWVFDDIRTETPRVLMPARRRDCTTH